MKWTLVPVAVLLFATLAGWVHGQPAPAGESAAAAKSVDEPETPKQMLALCVRYLKGSGEVAKDLTQAARWCQRAAREGYGPAQSRLATMYYLGEGLKKSAKEAALWFRKAAESGDSDAQAVIGAMYLEGDGVEKNSASAARWFHKAGDQGNESAQYTLAVMYSKGEGIAKDEAKAAVWYRKAAEQGFASAQHNLALMYWNGQGGLDDRVEGLAWVYVAGVFEHPNAEALRDRLLPQLTAEQVARAKARSLELVGEIEGEKSPHKSQ